MKMKGLLAVIFLVVSGVAAEAPAAPYPPSGFRPNGPAFELPQKQTQNTPQQQYLPAFDPRNQQSPNTEYGVPNTAEEDDVSVQGLPTQEQLPIFQPSPISGQQYVGPALQADLKSLDERYRQQQYQIQQEQYRAYRRQQELEYQANNGNSQQQPGLFGRTTITRPENSFTTQRNEDGTTVSSTTEALDLNEGETLEDNSQKKEKVSVEVSKQKLQEYPGEFYLSSFAQLQLQPQFGPVQQFGQLRAPLIIQPQTTSQQQVAGYDAQTHFAALPSVLAQRQILEQQAVIQNQQRLFPNPAITSQQPSYVDAAPVQPLNQYQPFAQPQLQPFPQIQAQPSVIPQAVNQPNYYGQPEPQPDTEEVEVKNVQPQPQYVYQQAYQPQDIYQQPFNGQTNQFSPDQQPLFLSQAQLVSYPNQDYQNGFNQPQFIAQQQNQPGYQGQDAFLQSGLDVNQQGNGVEQTEEKDNPEDGTQDNTATAVATAFGTRTQPRVFTQYGAPFPRSQVTPGYQSTTESAAEATTDEGPAVVEARAVAAGTKRKSAKLRNRRVRPIFTLDRSGHLVLAEQN